MQGLLPSMLAVLVCFAVPHTDAYQIPELYFQKLSHGFQISIPDEEGIARVAFNVNRNRPFETFEQGDFSEQIRSPTNGRYVYEVNRQLDDDDILYVWLSVQHRNLIYRKIAEPISIRSNSASNKGPTEAHRGNDTVENSSPNHVPTPVEQRPPAGNDECVPTRTKVTRNGKTYTPTCRGELIFNEEFDSNALKTDVWTAEVRLSTDTCEDEFVLYNTSNIVVANDLLSLRATLWNDNRPGTEIRQGALDLGDKCTESFRGYCERRPHGAIVMPPVISGRINTKSSFSFQYGRIVARAKFPQGDWLYPLLLLEPVLVLINDPLPCLHARIAFNRGNEHLTNIAHTEDIGAHRLSGGIILTGHERNRNQFTVNRTSFESFSADFHNYEMVWDEDYVIFKVDEGEYGRIRIADVYASEAGVNQNQHQTNGLLGREFAVSLGLAAGGHADFPDRGYTKPWVNTAPKADLFFWRQRETWLRSWTDPTMQVDYVRVYAI